MHDAFLMLQLAVHLQQARLDERLALLAPDALPDDDVHLAALILQRQEGDATGGRGALPHEHETGGAHPRAVGGACQLARGQELVYSGTFTEDAQAPNVHFQRGYHLDLYVFVLEFV